MPRNRSRRKTKNLSRSDRLKAGILMAGFLLLLAGLFYVGVREPPVYQGLVPCVEGGALDYHKHLELQLVVDGEEVGIPAGIGIPGNCIYWIHTHDDSGVIHIESPRPYTFTLGHLIQVWGIDLTDDRYQGWPSNVEVYIDGERYEGPLRDAPLKPGSTIRIEVTTTQ
ncbi:MAG: hypothetical protein F7B20_03720 [Aeropyrum sp.]|nr:hypothetical protein [Aeropyrum sp.]